MRMTPTRSENCTSSHTFLAAGIPVSVAVVFLMAAILPLQILAQGGETVTSPSGKHNIILLVDNSKSVVEGAPVTGGRRTDPADRRLRLVRFLTNYAQAFWGKDVRIGVISFADDVETLVPLDAADRLPPYLVIANPDIQGTNFRMAFQEAITQLEKVSCAEQNCSILLLTDGIFYEEEKEGIRQSLKSLSEKEIALQIILFAGAEDALAEEEGFTEYPEQWTTWLRKMGGNRNRIFTNPYSTKPEELYRAILSPLEMEAPFDTLKRISLTETHRLTLEIPPYRRYFRIHLLMEPAGRDTWSLPPTLQAGAERYWLYPPAGMLTATLEPAAGAGRMLVWYDVYSRPQDISLQARLEPNKQAAGKPVTLQAWIVGEGKIITATGNFTVAAHIGDKTYPLDHQENGSFSALVTPTFTGARVVTFTANIAGPEIPDIAIAPVTQSLYVDVLPRLKSLDATLTPVSTLVSPVQVTVTVENAPPVAPTLHFSSSLHPASGNIPLTEVESGVYTGAIEARPGEALLLQAVLPAGVTRRGIPFAEQRLAYRMVVDNLLIQAQVIPAKQKAGQPVELQASIRRGNQILTDPNLKVQVHLEPTGKTYTLTQDARGYFGKIITFPIPQKYTVTFSAAASPSLHTNSKTQRQLSIEAAEIPAVRSNAPLGEKWIAAIAGAAIAGVGYLFLSRKKNVPLEVLDFTRGRKGIIAGFETYRKKQLTSQKWQKLKESFAREVEKIIFEEQSSQ